MMGRRMQRKRQTYFQPSKNETTSVSTEESFSPNNIPKCSFRNKEKSQLCRKFMEKGECPYQKRCKFAHGSHQLKNHDSVNLKYKTKECGSFFKEGNCKFGERCNFLHSKIERREQLDWKSLMHSYQQVFQKGQSKIAHLF